MDKLIDRQIGLFPRPACMYVCVRRKAWDSSLFLVYWRSWSSLDYTIVYLRNTSNRFLWGCCACLCSLKVELHPSGVGSLSPLWAIEILVLLLLHTSVTVCMQQCIYFGWKQKIKIKMTKMRTACNTILYIVCNTILYIVCIMYSYYADVQSLILFCVVLSTTQPPQHEAQHCFGTSTAVFGAWGDDKGLDLLHELTWHAHYYTNHHIDAYFAFCSWSNV